MNKERMDELRRVCEERGITIRQSYYEAYRMLRLYIQLQSDPLIVKANERLALAHDKGVKYPYPFVDVAPWTPRGAWFMREYLKAMNRKRDRER
jgi:hypothetical protein